jgi:hypothetical protein
MLDHKLEMHFFTARSLRSLKAQRTQRGSFLSEWREGGHSDKPATLRVNVWPAPAC